MDQQVFSPMMESQSLMNVLLTIQRLVNQWEHWHLMGSQNRFLLLLHIHIHSNQFVFNQNQSFFVYGLNKNERKTNYFRLPENTLPLTFQWRLISTGCPPIEHKTFFKVLQNKNNGYTVSSITNTQQWFLLTQHTQPKRNRDTHRPQN